jgi:hypothetical protein
MSVGVLSQPQIRLEAPGTTYVKLVCKDELWISGNYTCNANTTSCDE